MADSKRSMSSQWQNSHLDGDSASYLENLYQQYLLDPSKLEAKWRDYFAEIGSKEDTNHSQIVEQFVNLAKHNLNLSTNITSRQIDLEHENKQIKVLEMIAAFRTRGHQNANLDPLNQTERPYIEDLDLSYYGFSKQDLASNFNASDFASKKKANLGEIYSSLQEIYCGTIGTEYTHITSRVEREWIQERLEGNNAKPTFSKQTKLNLLKQLTAAEGIEKFLHTKYVGQKRFSIEGGESLIPLLDELIQRSGEQGIREIGIGMAHRGRLNVLVNILGKNPKDLCDEFEGKAKKGELSSGDVKYHQGFSSDVKTKGQDVHLALAFNPSHLEIVSPVVVGSVRARIEKRKDKNKTEVLAISIHGDSAFAGQGVVMETLNMSQTRGYQIGGTVHIVVNNQVGFTTSNPLDTRSTTYCTDVAKMVQSPIFHVNTDDPEAVLTVAQLALDYRNTFKKDVVIDLVCYRRHGHNEADEPSATQPMMYKLVRSLPSVRTLYAHKLIDEGVITSEIEKQYVDNYRNKLQAGISVLDNLQYQPNNEYVADWNKYFGHFWDVAVEVDYPKKSLQELMHAMLNFPKDFVLQPQVAKVMRDREMMANEEIKLDWGAAENLAYATLLEQGFNVRLSGQDSGRGTFAHRHAVLHDQENGEIFVPLVDGMPNTKNNFLVINSLLSEEAVLAFEYGYATTDPKTLVIWEAQFGDFANGAQVVIDQFISSGEQKWGRLCGLVMLLPHGYEGMGPEHSSARLERYLQLCAEHNMQVCVPSTPAQMYHMLRRQMLRPYRKPLIVMTPKSFLRNKLATSSLDELATGSFKTIIGEIDELDKNNIKRIVLCAGKIYYELLQKRRDEGNNQVALIRVEQLYPFPKENFKAVMSAYKHVKDIIWCQEEPKNQGAWYSILHHLKANTNDNQQISFIGRKASASPAVGDANLHHKQQADLLERALDLKLV